MEQDKHSAEFNHMTVLNFRMMDAQTLQALVKDLSLSLTPAALARLQQYFAMREGRDPTVGELRLVNAVARAYYQSPAQTRIIGATGDEALGCALRDVLTKRAAMQEQPGATLGEIFATSAEFLKRCGVYAHSDLLYCGEDAALAALAHGVRPKLAAQLPHCSAALLGEEPLPVQKHGVLLLLSPSGHRPFANEIALFFAQVRGLGISPLALIGDEGLLPHLLDFDGVTLDLSTLSDYDAASGPASLAACGKGKLLLLCDEGDAAALRCAPTQLAFIGAVGHSGKLLMRHGLALSVSLELSLLRSLQSLHTLQPALTSKAPRRAETVQAQNATSQLLGVEVEGDPTQALLSLAVQAFEKGGVMESTTLSAALLLPAAPRPEILEEAFSSLLALHRSCCELTFPLVHTRLLYHGDLQTPLLALWLFCSRGAERAPLATAPLSPQEARELFFSKAD